MNGNNTSESEVSTQWLWMLFFLYAASLIVWLLDFLFLPYDTANLLSTAISVSIIFGLFMLGSMGKRYRKAAIFRTISFCTTLMVSLVLTRIFLSLQRWEITNQIGQIIQWSVWVLLILGGYQEHYGHADLIAQKDSGLSKKWRFLFGYNLIMNLVGTGVSLALAYYYAKLNMSAGVANAISITIQIGSRVFTIIYLWYLYRTIRLLENS